MSEMEERIIETLKEVLPRMSDESRNYLLGYGEGIAASLANAEDGQAAEGQPVA